VTTALRTCRLSIPDLPQRRMTSATIAPSGDFAPAARPIRSSEYVPALDGLRFLAFFAVFIRHTLAAWSFLADPNAPASVEVWTFGQYGWMGVDLFLALSAFLLTRLLLVERERFGKINVPRFFARRALRIWPLYFALLAVGFSTSQVVGADYIDPMILRHHLLAFSLFLGNWSSALYGFAQSPLLALLWTVSLEEQFYLLLPLVIAAIARRRSLALVAFGAMAFSILVRTWLLANGAKSTTLYLITPTRLDSFAMGILLALAAPEVKRWASHARNKVLLSGILLAALLLIFVTGSRDRPGPHLIYMYPLIAICAGCALTFALVPGWFSGLLSRKPLTYLGKISYGLYALHGGALWIVGLVSTSLPFAVRFALSLALSVALASVSYRYLERPFLLVKQRFTVVPSRPV
jgi:peptidoglycan/LPS O-acetylase OafA/YrhL